MSSLKNKNILIISPDSWDFLSVSKHHYAIELAKNNKVYFLNPPATSNEKIMIIDKGVNVLYNYRKIKGINKIPLTFIKRFFMKLEIKSILKKTSENKIDIVWSFDTSRLYYLDLFGVNIKIAHLVDLSENFFFKEITLSANYCFSVAESISRKISIYNKNVFKINHGYFIPIEKIKTDNNKENRGVYFGNLNMKYIDWESIYILIKNYPNLKFDFYGNHNLNTLNKNKYFNKLTQLSNASVYNPVSSENLIEILAKSKFCFVSYLHLEYGEQLDNSHKIMQYLGSGAPVFSSFTFEYRDLNLFPMYQDKNDILEVFKKFINNEFNDFTEESKIKRINFAMDNTYSKQIERIEEIIFKNNEI